MDDQPTGRGLPIGVSNHGVAGSLLDSTSTLQVWADGIISHLTGLTDETVLAVRNTAYELREQAWRIVCACDAEILNRSHARRGRGHRDENGTGVVATIRAVAVEANVSPSTIYRNAQLYRTFGEKLLTYQTILPEKEYYEAALRTDDPHGTLEGFAQQKEVNPHFSTFDALRQAKAIRLAEQGEIPIGDGRIVCPQCGFRFSS